MRTDGGWLVATEEPRRSRRRADRKPGPGKETLLVRSVIETLHRLGCPAWRCGVGSKEWTDSEGKRRFAMFGMKGLPDIMGIIPPTGRFIGIECKVDGNQLTKDQKRVLGDFAAAGVFVAVVRDTTDGLAEMVRAAIDEARATRTARAS